MPRLSIIIPVRDEEQTIPGVLRSLATQDMIDACQVIVVDGESIDNTVEAAGSFPFVDVLRSQPGLARQMNVGASAAEAPNLWFIHADSTLPNRHTVSAILQELDKPLVVGGTCLFHLRGNDTYYSWISMLVNVRARLLKRPYGDQGIFVTAKAFDEAGGFHAMSCYDLDFMMRLRKLGQIALIPMRVETSARTWKKFGKYRTTVSHLMEWLRYEYQLARGKGRHLKDGDWKRPSTRRPFESSPPVQNGEPEQS